MKRVEVRFMIKFFTDKLTTQIITIWGGGGNNPFFSIFFHVFYMYVRADFWNLVSGEPSFYKLVKIVFLVLNLRKTKIMLVSFLINESLH